MAMTCEVCGSELVDLGAHGDGCPVCAEREDIARNLDHHWRHAELSPTVDDLRDSVAFALKDADPATVDAVTTLLVATGRHVWRQPGVKA